MAVSWVNLVWFVYSIVARHFCKVGHYPTLINLVPTGHHPPLLQYYRRYSPCCFLHPHDCSNNQPVLLRPFTFFTRPLVPSHLAAISLFPVSIRVVPLYCIYIPRISEILWYLTFSVWLTSLNALWVHPCCHKWWDFILFCGWVTFHCMYVPHP